MEVDIAILDFIHCRGALGFHAVVFVIIIADASDTSCSSSVTMSYEDYYADQGHLLPLKRGSSVVPETGGK